MPSSANRMLCIYWGHFRIIASGPLSTNPGWKSIHWMAMGRRANISLKKSPVHSPASSARLAQHYTYLSMENEQKWMEFVWRLVAIVQFRRMAHGAQWSIHYSFFFSFHFSIVSNINTNQLFAFTFIQNNVIKIDTARERCVRAYPSSAVCVSGTI